MINGDILIESGRPVFGAEFTLVDGKGQAFATLFEIRPTWASPKDQTRKALAAGEELGESMAMTLGFSLTFDGKL